MLAIERVEDQRQAGRQIELRNGFPGAGDFLIVLRRFHNRGYKSVARGQQRAAFDEKTGARVFQRADGVGKERQDPANVRDDDVDALWQMNLTRVATQEMNAVGNAVDRREMAAKLDGLAEIDSVHAACSGLAGQQRKDAGTATEVQNGVAGTDGFLNSGCVGVHADTVGEHGGELVEGVETHAGRLAEEPVAGPELFAAFASSSSHMAEIFAGSLLGTRRRTGTCETKRAMASNSSARCCFSSR